MPHDWGSDGKQLSNWTFYSLAHIALGGLLLIPSQWLGEKAHHQPSNSTSPKWQTHSRVTLSAELITRSALSLVNH